MDVKINEAGGDQEAGGVDDFVSQVRKVRPQLDDGLAFDADINLGFDAGVEHATMFDEVALGDLFAKDGELGRREGRLGHGWHPGVGGRSILGVSDPGVGSPASGVLKCRVKSVS